MITTNDVGAAHPAVPNEASSQPIFPSKKARLDFVDGLRGLAIIATLLCHTWLYDGQYKTQARFNGLYLSNWFGVMTIGVNLFMVISGFCLTYPLVRTDGWKVMNVKDFFVRRIIRIIPPYYAAIALFVLLGLLMPLIYHDTNPLHYTGFAVPTFTTVTGHLLFSFNIFLAINPQLQGLSGSFWSLELEAHFYLALPLLLYLARRFGVLNMVGGVLVLTVIWRMWVWNNIAPHSSPLIIQFWSRAAPGRLFEFALGILAAVVFVRYRPQINSWVSLALALLILWVGIGYSYIHLGEFAPLTDILIGIGFFFLMLAASVPGIAQNISTWRPLTRLGVISYSVYLIHEPFIKELYTWFPGMNGRIAFFVYSIGFSLLMIVLGYGFYLVVERPAINWGRRLARRQQVTTALNEESPVVATSAEQHAAP